MAVFKLKCFKCGVETEFSDSVGIRDECQNCGEDSHCCRNCRFYDPKVYNECKETSADVVREKDRSNFCDYYQPSTGDGGTGPTRDQLKNAAEALFKKKS
ncbi:MAG: hypothetical protein IT288_12835 [Bdellovibrionales bacterium]|nr:hypothetical protein [Bdellovibrionales bacterium]